MSGPRKSSGKNTGASTSQRFRPVHLIQSLSLLQWDGVWSRARAGGTEAPWCSDVEAFSTATRALDVGIVEDEFA